MLGNHPSQGLEHLPQTGKRQPGKQGRIPSAKVCRGNRKAQ